MLFQSSFLQKTQPWLSYRFMKMNTIEKLRDCLRDMSPQIEMDEDVRKQAYVPLKRMLDWSK